MKNNFKIIGFTDSVNNCDCCGKSNLKGTYCIQIDEQEFYYGTTCAANSINVSSDEFKKEIKKITLEKSIDDLVLNSKTEYSKRNILKLALKKGFNKIDFFLKYGKISDENNFGYFYEFANINVWVDK